MQNNFALCQKRIKLLHCLENYAQIWMNQNRANCDTVLSSGIGEKSKRGRSCNFPT